MALAKTLFLGCVHFDLGFDVDTEFDIVKISCGIQSIHAVSFQCGSA